MVWPFPLSGRRGLAFFPHALWVGLAASASRSQSGSGCTTSGLRLSHVASLRWLVMLAVAPSGPGQSPDWPCPLGRRGLALVSHALWGGVGCLGVPRLSRAAFAAQDFGCGTHATPWAHGVGRLPCRGLGQSRALAMSTRSEGGTNHGAATRPLVPRMWGETPPRSPRGGCGELVLVGPPHNFTATRGAACVPARRAPTSVGGCLLTAIPRNSPAAANCVLARL